MKVKHVAITAIKKRIDIFVTLLLEVFKKYSQNIAIRNILILPNQNPDRIGVSGYTELAFRNKSTPSEYAKRRKGAAMKIANT